MFTSTCCYFVCLCILTLLVINDLFLFMFSVLLTYFSFRPRYVLLRFLRLQSRRIARHLDSGASGQSKIDNTFLKSQQYFCTTGHIASGRTSPSVSLARVVSLLIPFMLLCIYSTSLNSFIFRFFRFCLLWHKAGP